MAVNDHSSLPVPTLSDWRAHHWLRRLHEPDCPDSDILAWRLGQGADIGAVLTRAMALPAAIPALTQEFTWESGDLRAGIRPTPPPRILRAPDLAAALRELPALRPGTDQQPFLICLILTPQDAILALRISRIAGGDGVLAQVKAGLEGRVAATTADPAPVLTRASLGWMARRTGVGAGAGEGEGEGEGESTGEIVASCLSQPDVGGLADHAARALAAALADLGGPSGISVLPEGLRAVDLARAAAACPGGPVVIGLLAPDEGLSDAPLASRLGVPPVHDPVGPSILLGLRPVEGQVLAELSCAPACAPGLAALLMDRLAAHWAAPQPAPAVMPDPATRILQEFRSALAAPGMGPDDDFFDHGGHSLTATRIVGRLASQHGIRLRFEDVFTHPTARGLAATATLDNPGCPAAPSSLPASDAPAPLSLAQTSLWKVYAAMGKGDIFNIPFALRFLDPVDEDVFGAAFRDLLIRHPVLRSLFAEDAQGRVTQQPVPADALEGYDWFQSSALAGDLTRRQEAGHVFDLSRELPLRLRFLREAGQQVLSLLFHHVVLDEWSVDLLMNDLARAYAARVAGAAPVWDDVPASFDDFVRAQAAAGPGDDHLFYWTDRLRGAPARRPFVAGSAAEQAETSAATDGGWREIAVPAPVSAGLYDAARAANASLFNIVYAAIAAALRDVSAQDDLVIGTSASGRGDPACFDTVGYFTTVVAHRLQLLPDDTPQGLVARVRDMINGSLPHDSIPIDLVEEALSHPGPEHMFELFIQIHAGNRMNGVLSGPDGRAIRYRQIDPDKTESLLGLQFEVLEDVIDDARALRVMMSYRKDSYGPGDVARLVAAVSAMFALFADPAARTAPVMAAP